MQIIKNHLKQTLPNIQINKNRITNQKQIIELHPTHADLKHNLTIEEIKETYKITIDATPTPYHGIIIKTIPYSNPNLLQELQEWLENADKYLKNHCSSGAITTSSTIKSTANQEPEGMN